MTLDRIDPPEYFDELVNFIKSNYNMIKSTDDVEEFNAREGRQRTISFTILTGYKDDHK